MPIIRIDDADDPRIADYRNVPDPDLLRDRGLFVAENRLVVRALLVSGRFRTRSVLVTDAALASLHDVLAARTDVLPIYVCPKSLMQPISGHHIHRGCLALGERRVPQTVAQLLGGMPRMGRAVVLEAMTNADNVGAVFRNARAFGVDAVIVGPRCCDPLYRKAIRVSIGATLEVPYALSGHDPAEAASHVRRADPACATSGPASAGAQHASARSQDSTRGSREGPSSGFAADLLRLKHLGFVLAALTPARNAVDLNDFAAGPLPERVAVLVGNEGEGLSAEAQRASDVLVRIRMADGVDSLNAGTAAGIAMHRLMAAEQ